VDAAVLAVARGDSVRLPKAPPPSLGNPRTDDFAWILGQLALLGRTDVVRSLLDSGSFRLLYDRAGLTRCPSG
jgi:hypothetical protein